MTISVIIPIHKSIKCEHIKISLHSIITQSIKPSEIIIICDGILNENVNEYLNNIVDSTKHIHIIILKIVLILGQDYLEIRV